MDGTTLQDTAQECAEQLPATTTYPFAPGWEAVRVHEKWFLLLTELGGQPLVICKADPGEADALRGTYAEITPGYHMNKRHWITVAAGDAVDAKLVHELVTESYRLVVGKLPKYRQPVAPTVAAIENARGDG